MRNNKKRSKQTDFDTANLRKMLMEAFNDDEFTLLCFDYFRPVYENFVVGMGRLLKTQLLIDYCYRHGKLNELLDQVRELNPYQYDKFFTITNSTSDKLQRQPNSIVKGTQNILEVTVSGNFSTLSPQQLETVVGAFTGALAGVLGISQNEIQALKVSIGSLILELQMPSHASAQFQKAYKENNALIKELGIQNIKLVVSLPNSVGNFVESLRKRYPPLSAIDAEVLSSALLEEITKSLIEGKDLAFVKIQPDKSLELTVLEIIKDSNSWKLFKKEE